MPNLTLKEILTRLLADVDDNMEFAGTMWKSRQDASKEVSGSLAEAEASIKALMLEEQIELLESLLKSAATSATASRSNPAEKYSGIVEIRFKIAELRLRVEKL